MKNSRITLYIDFFFCFIFLPLIIAFVPVEKWITTYPLFATTLFAYLYILFFVIKWFRLPQKVIQRKYWQVTLFSVIILTTTYLLSKFPYPSDLTTNHISVGSWNITHRAQTVWLLSIIVIGYSLSISLVFELFRQNSAKKELEEDKKNAELALYKAQLNPHFLFNTLNTLYGLVVCKSDKAEDAFVRFTNLMKYAYSHVDASKISIQKEIDYIRNYIELQKLRLNHHTTVEMSVDLDDGAILIPPMILISFIENAFKYGTSASRDCKIEISIVLRDRLLNFRCINQVMDKKSHAGASSVGIENTKARLERIYPHKFDLVIDESGGNFLVSLKLNV